MTNTPQTTMPANLVVLLLALLLGVQPVATDLYLPVLPALKGDFAASMAQMQLTLTALLLSFGLSQLVWGPLSDRFGRRPVLLVGLAGYALAAVCTLLAPDIDWLIAGRALQGLAMGAAVVCARAMVRDLYQPLAGATVMSKGLSGLGLIACVSAPLGGLLSDHFGWRVAISALAVFGTVTLALVALRFEETLKTQDLSALNLRLLLPRWRSILRHPTFWAYSALAASAYGGLFTFLATSAFVFIQVLGLSKTQYGLLFSSMSMAYILGTWLCRRLLARLGVRKSVALAGGLTLTGGMAIAALAYAGIHTVWALMVPYYLYMLGHGVHQSCSQSGAVGPFPQAAGTASALNGFITTVVAFAMGSWLGTHMDGTVYPLAYGLLFWSCCVAATAWVLVWRYGEAKKEPQP